MTTQDSEKTESEPLHIGFLQTYFLESEPGGGEVHTECMARNLQSLGHKVTIFTDTPQDKRTVDDLNVETYDTPIKSNPINENAMANSAMSDMEKCDVVFLTDDSAWRGVDVETPTAMIFHIVWHGVVQRFGGLRGAMKQKPQALWYARMEHKICRKTDAIVSISPNMLDDIGLIGDFEDKVVNIPNGVDTNRFHPIDDSYDRFTAHFQGRLVQDKNPLMLVEAANLSRENWALKIGGNGPLKEDIKKRIRDCGLEDRVDVLGYVPDEKLPTAYSKSDVYVLPSDYEGMPLTVIEASSAGTPVLVSRRAATDFVTKDMGTIIDDVSAQQVADSLDNMYVRQNEVEQMGKNARTRAEQYSWERITDKYEDLATQLAL